MNDRLSNSAQAFNLNLVRFKNFRQRMNRAHDRETGALRQTVESFKQEASAYSDLLKRGPTAVGDLYDASHNALSWARLFERQLERMPDEAALGREMAFVYLMAILDGFVARWRIDMSLDAEGEKAESSRPNVIRDTCRELMSLV